MLKIFFSTLLLTTLILSSGKVLADEKPLLDFFQATQADLYIDDVSSRSLALIVTLDFLNNTQTQKLDYDTTVSFRLTDEFGNRYRSVPPPAQSFIAANTSPATFPSFYPGDRSTTVLFFEPPVPKAKKLKLIISAQNSNGQDKEILLPDKKEIRSPKADLPVVELAPKDPLAEISVEGLANGTILQQGENAKISVIAPKGPLPDRITVIVFNKTLEDNAPATKNVYDINVPFEMPPGQYTINILAQWKQGDTFRTSSVEVRFNVADVFPAEML